MDTVGIGEGSGATLTITSLVFSGLGLLYSLYTACWSDRKKAKLYGADGRIKPPAAASGTRNPAFNAAASSI